MDDTQSASEVLAKTVEAVEEIKGQVLQVIQYPDPRLKEVSKPVLGDIKSDRGLQQLIQDMLATLKAYRAVGLAAIQVGVPARVLVVQDASQQPEVVINPVIKELDEEKVRSSEGCLSFPGFFLEIWRPTEVVVEYFDQNGEKKTAAADKLLARAIQHEMDHLDGLTFIDRLPKVRRQDALRKFEIESKKRRKAIEKFLKAQKKSA